MTPEELFDKGRQILKSKAEDYTSGGANSSSRYENFDRQMQLTSWFKNECDKVFMSLIAVKIARLSTLLNGKEPKNESIEDSFIDLINYCALWAGYRTSKAPILCGYCSKRIDMVSEMPIVYNGKTYCCDRHRELGSKDSTIQLVEPLKDF